MAQTMNGQQIFRLMLGVAATLGAAAFARAQSAPVRLTLDEAMARGLQTSHQLAELAARTDQWQAVVQMNDASDRPQVTAIAGYTRTNHVDEFGIQQPGQPPRIIYPDVPDNYRTRLDLQWPIYTGGRTDALLRAARAEAAASGEDLSTARADLRLEITRAFWAVVTSNEAVHVLEESLRRVEAHLTDVRNRLAVGLVPPNDVLSAEAHRSRQEGLLIDARMRRDSALADLARLVGLAADTAITLDVALTPAAAPAESPSALAEQARAERPERRAIAQRIAATGARREAAATGTKPQMSVVGGVDYANPNPRIFPRADEWQGSWDAGVTVAWSLWDGGRVKAQVAETAAAERAFRERLLDLDTRIEVDVRQRGLELESSLAAIRAAEDGVRSATEARRVVTDRFNAGVATSTDVLDAQTDLLTAELERTRALANSRLAEARRARALGR
jgi:outer membrane protein TolC